MAHGVRSGGLTSLLVADGLDTEVRLDKDASPLGDRTATPWASTPAVAGSWWVTAVCLAAAPRHDPPTAAVTAQQLTVTWPDGRRDHARTCPTSSPTSSSTRATAPDVTTTKRRAP